MYGKVKLFAGDVVRQGKVTIGLGFMIYFVTIGAISVMGQSEIRLDIGAKISSTLAKKSSYYTFTAASQMFPAVDVSINNVEYTIAFDKKTRKIKYIYTDDEDFKNSDGFRVGETKTFKWADLDVLGYFEVRGPEDKNGWQAVIGGSSAFEGHFLESFEKAGQFTTEIIGFAKGYNY